MPRIQIPFAYSAQVLNEGIQFQQIFRGNLFLNKEAIPHLDAPVEFQIPCLDCAELRPGLNGASQLRRYNGKLWRTACIMQEGDPDLHMVSWLMDTDLVHTPLSPAIRESMFTDQPGYRFPTAFLSEGEWLEGQSEGEGLIEWDNAAAIKAELEKADILFVAQTDGTTDFLVPCQIPYYRLDVKDGRVLINVCYGKAEPNYDDRTICHHKDYHQAREVARELAIELKLDPQNAVEGLGKILCLKEPIVRAGRPAELDFRN